MHAFVLEDHGIAHLTGLADLPRPINRQPRRLPFALPALWFTMQATEVHGTPTQAPGAAVIGYPSRAT